ncbi:MAG TPA: hypothetical protein VJ761_25925, partial [Ktedonobacteraceae bacterium]|nr:hypothetical protein [Ktedonobacteraceae bacterium]
QEDFRIAAGVTLRTVQEWESNNMTADMGRRIFLAKMLKIPPALLGLAWQSLLDEEGMPLYREALEHTASFLKEHSYGLYEDLLAFGYACSASGISPTMAYRFQQHQQELERLVESAPEREKAAWKDLLCRFYQLSTFIVQRHTQHRRKDEQAPAYADQAVTIAHALEDTELLTAALYRRSRLHLLQNREQAARQDIQGAMAYVDQVRGPLKGNTYLLAAEIHALHSQGDEKLQSQCRKWQEKAATILYRGNLEEDSSSLWFDLYAVHHERAKTLARFALFHTTDEELIELLKATHTRADAKLLEDAQAALALAWNTIETSPSLEKKLDFSLTEVRLFILARELEEAAKTAKKALQFAQFAYSQEGVKEVTQLYTILNSLAPQNPYVRNLGIELNLF